MNSNLTLHLIRTPVKKTYVVKLSEVWLKIFRFCLFGPVVQFTGLFSNYVVITLTSDFSFAADVTLVDG